MVPIAVLIQLPTTHPTMSLTTKTTSSPFTATSRDTTLSNVGVYQKTVIESSDISIRTLVPDPISAEPYRKSLIANRFFRQIITLSDRPSVSFSYLMLTVTSYFGLNTGSAEREAEATFISIHNDFFLVSNLQGVEFSDPSGKPITLLDQIRRPADLAYFNFRSVVSAATIDIRTLISSLSLEFLLRLPKSLSTSISSPIYISTHQRIAQ